MKKPINEKNIVTVLNKSVYCSMGSQQNFFYNFLNEIQFLWDEVRMKIVIIKKSIIAEKIEA